MEYRAGVHRGVPSPSCERLRSLNRTLTRRYTVAAVYPCPGGPSPFGPATAAHQDLGVEAGTWSRSHGRVRPLRPHPSLALPIHTVSARSTSALHSLD